MTIAEQKQALRRMIAVKRREHQSAELEEWSARILERVLDLDVYKSAGVVFAYMDLPGEVQTRALIERCWKDGKRVAVPRVERVIKLRTDEKTSGSGEASRAAGKTAGSGEPSKEAEITGGGRMKFYEIRSFAHLAPGAMHILEPDPAFCPSLDDAEDALVILPGVAFNRELNRPGYGGGYYDRYLHIHGSHPTVAAAFDFQVVSKVPHEKNDLRPEILVTENYTLYGS